MIKSRKRFSIRVHLASILAVASILPSALRAHAVVFPKTSTPRAYEKYVLRVPNEKRVATTRVEIRFPADIRVVSFADVAGWQLKTVTDSAGRIVAAEWTGTLHPERFIEFPFVAVNPDREARLVWPAYQSYADGERVEWVGPVDSPRPASVTVLEPAETTSGWVRYVSLAALLLALASLGLVMRPRESRTAP